MKIAIISDTHDNTPAIVWIIEYLNKNEIHSALHAGDIINPGNIAIFEETYKGELHFVFGNNDGDHGRIMNMVSKSSKLFCYHETMEKEFIDKSFFMNHYSSISELVAKSGEFDFIIGGHDHKYRIIKHGKSTFINPGTTSLTDISRGFLAKDQLSFVIIDLDTNQIERINLPENL